MANANFIGLEPWFDNFPRVDFITPDGIVDLHNNAALEEIRVNPAVPSLILRFRYSIDWTRIDTGGCSAQIEFQRVWKLKIEQAENFDSRAAITLEGIVYDIVENLPSFSIDLGDIQCTFFAENIALRVG